MFNFLCTPQYLLILSSLDSYEISFAHAMRNQFSYAIVMAEPNYRGFWTCWLPNPDSTTRQISLTGCGSCWMKTAIWSHRWVLGPGGKTKVYEQLPKQFDGSSIRVTIFPWHSKHFFYTENLSKQILI